MSETAVVAADEQPQAPAQSLIAVIERAALNPEVDVEKMEKLLDMQERIMDRHAQEEFSRAMAAAQGDMPVISKDTKGDQGKYFFATLPKIIAQAQPIWMKNGFALSFSQAPIEREGMIRIVCDVRHIAGHSERYFIDMPDTNKSMQGKDIMSRSQEIGSNVTYGRRYLTCMIFNIATGDDKDGAAPPAPPPQDEAFLKLEADLSAAADDGMEQLESAWKSLKPGQRKRVGTSMLNALKERARMAPQVEPLTGDRDE